MRFSRIGILRLLISLVTILAALAATLAPNPLSTSATPPQAIHKSTPFADVNPLGANFFLDREVETWKKEQTLKMARDAGIGWAKQMFAWEEIEPKKDRYWDERYRTSTWDKFDEIVNLSEKYGIKIIARLDRPPAWARPEGTDSSAPPSDLTDYGNYVYNVVNRYKGRIQYYQIWNEPNLASEWGNKPPSAAQYVELLKVAYKRAKEADPNVVILSAPLATTLEQGPTNVSDLTYLQDLYKAGGKAYFDIMSANAYGFDKPPSDPASPNVLNFARVTLLRKVMEDNGDASKPIWFNEFGWNASPADFPKDRLYWGRVTEQQQADYTAEAINMIETWDWAGVVNIWYFRQVGDISPMDRSDYYFRVVDVNFTPRPVYNSLQRISSSIKIAPSGDYQESTAAADLVGRWKTILDPRFSGKAAVSSESPGNSLSFTFYGSEVDLLAKTDPFSGQAQIEVDGAPASELPKDSRGKAILDLYSQDDRWQVKIPLVRGLPPGKHILTLTVAGPSKSPTQGGAVIVDGFSVQNEPYFYWDFYAKIGLALLSLVGLVATFLARRR